MASGSRTLKLSILADVDNLRKGLNEAEGNVSGFGGKLDGFAAKAGMAFAAAGAAAALYAGKLAIDGVKSAIEDEAAQTKLATTLRNVTGATSDQVKATEDYILKTELAYGKTDNELRPSLDRLVRSTKNVEEAQKLQTLALDIAAGTGKSLEAVTNALAKAHDGSTASLGKLGTGIDAATLKTMNFDQVTQALAGTFQGQAQLQTETFQGKMDRLNVAFSEAKETVGSYILDAVTPMLTTIVDKVIPAVSDFAGGISGTLSPVIQDIAEFMKALFTPILEGVKKAFGFVSAAVKDNSAELEVFMSWVKSLWDFIKKYLAPLLGDTLKVAFEVVGVVVSGLIRSFSILVGIIQDALKVLRDLVKFITNNPIVQGIGDMVGGLFGGGKATGGPVSGGTTYLVGERGPELFTPGGSGFITPNGAGGGMTVNINVSGAIDPISTARQIADILGTAATSAGSFSNLGLSRVVGA